MKISKKADRKKEIIGICLDCFIEKGLTVTTTTDLCNANNLQNGGIYYYFDTKEEMVLACAEEAISRIEQGAFGIVLDNIKDVANMMEHLGALADEMSPTMRFLVSVCVSREYGEKLSLILLSSQDATRITQKESHIYLIVPKRKRNRMFTFQYWQSTTI